MLQANLFNPIHAEVYAFNLCHLRGNITGIRLVVKAYCSHRYFDGALLCRESI